MRQDGGWAAQNIGGTPARGLILGDEEGRVWYGGEGTAEWVRWTDGGVERGREALPAGLEADEVLPTGKDKLVVVGGGKFHQLTQRNGRWEEAWSPVEIEIPPRRKHIFQGGNGVWGLACLMAWSDFANSANSVVLRPRHSPVGLAVDREKRVWAGNLVGGIDGAKRGSGIQIPYGVANSLSEVHSIARLGARLLLATDSEIMELGSNLHGIELCDGGTAEAVSQRRWPGAPQRQDYLAVLTESDGSVWTVPRRKNVVRTDRAGRVTEVGGGKPVQRPASNIWDLAWSEDDRLWAASKENLIEIARNGTLSYRTLFEGLRYFGRFVRDRRNRLFGISQEGLLRYENGAWRELGWPGCVLTDWVRTAAVVSDDEYWLGYRTRDGFTHARREGAGRPWSCQHFEAKGGFSGDTQFLRLDRQGRLWRGSESGLYFARDAERRPPGKPEDWNLVGGAMGMSEGEMGQVFEEEADGSILVVADRRLHRIPARMLEEDPGTNPRASFLRVGEESRLLGTLRWWKGDRAVLHMSSLGEVELAAPARLEYRFGGGGWRRARGHEIPMEGVPTNTGTLEIRYAGTNRALTLPWEIQLRWWQTGWAWGGACLALAGFGWLVWPWVARQRYAWEKRRFLRRQEAKQGTGAALIAAGWAVGTLVRERYRITGLVARGGFADVYSAVDERDGGEVVIKQVRPPAQMDPATESWLRRRFAQEIAAVSLIRRQPGILPILDNWVDGAGVPHLVMRKVNGPTLREVLQKRAPLGLEEALSLLGKIAETLAAAHAQGLVHCDLKPENILLEDGRPILIDFGTSALHLQTDTLSEATNPAGSIRYMAPEQLFGRFSPASDVYSFGVIALEVMTKLRYTDLSLPFDESWERELVATLRRERQLSDEVGGVFARALRHDPHRRETEVGAWFRALVGALGTRG